MEMPTPACISTTLLSRCELLYIAVALFGGTGVGKHAWNFLCQSGEDYALGLYRYLNVSEKLYLRTGETARSKPKRNLLLLFL